MFAFALWDARKRRLLLARDRAGKKPLFYHDGPRLFAFASEVKALLAHPEVPHERDPAALPLFLTYGYVPTPGTFYRGIRALPPGHTLVATEAGTEAPAALLARALSSGDAATGRRSIERRRGRGALPRRCCRPPSSAGSWPTCRSAPSSRAASTRRRSWRSWPRAAGGRVQDLHDRLRGRHGVRRARARAGRGRALRDRAHRVRGRAEGARPRRPAGLPPRRALRRLLGGADLPALGADAHAGDGGAQRRRRRRGVRRLPAALRRRPLRARAARGVSGRSRGCSACCRSPPTASTRCASRSASPRRAACRSLERYLRWNAYFTDDLPRLLRPELARASTASGCSRASRRATPRARARRSRACSSSTSRPTCSTTCW